MGAGHGQGRNLLQGIRLNLAEITPWDSKSKMLSLMLTCKITVLFQNVFLTPHILHSSMVITLRVVNYPLRAPSSSQSYTLKEAPWLSGCLSARKRLFMSAPSWICSHGTTHYHDHACWLLIYSTLQDLQPMVTQLVFQPTGTQFLHWV